MLGRLVLFLPLSSSKCLLIFIGFLIIPMASASPVRWQKLLEDTVGISISSGTGIEVGPGSEPICSDCIYVDLKNDLPLKYFWKFRRGDVRRLPLQTSSVQVLITKSLPWFISAILRTDPIGTLSQLNFLRKLKYTPDNIPQIAAANNRFISDALKEIKRVLVPNGILVILGQSSSGPVDFEDFLTAGLELGFSATQAQPHQADPLQLQGIAMFDQNLSPVCSSVLL